MFFFQENSDKILRLFSQLFPYWILGLFLGSRITKLKTPNPREPHGHRLRKTGQQPRIQSDDSESSSHLDGSVTLSSRTRCPTSRRRPPQPRSAADSAWLRRYNSRCPAPDFPPSLSPALSTRMEAGRIGGSASGVAKSTVAAAPCMRESRTQPCRPQHTGCRPGQYIAAPR